MICAVCAGRGRYQANTSATKRNVTLDCKTCKGTGWVNEPQFDARYQSREAFSMMPGSYRQAPVRYDEDEAQP